MDLEITAQIDQSLVPLAVALYVIGVFLKATPKIVDWTIPWILLLTAILSANVLLGWGINSSIQGVLSCGIGGVGESTLQAGAVRGTRKRIPEEKVNSKCCRVGAAK